MCRISCTLLRHHPIIPLLNPSPPDRIPTRRIRRRLTDGQDEQMSPCHQSCMSMTPRNRRLSNLTSAHRPPSTLSILAQPSLPPLHSVPSATASVATPYQDIATSSVSYVHARILLPYTSPITGTGFHSILSATHPDIIKHLPVRYLAAYIRGPPWERGTRRVESSRSGRGRRDAWWGQRDVEGRGVWEGFKVSRMGQSGSERVLFVLVCIL